VDIPVGQLGGNIFVPAQRVEVVFLVAVQRGFVAQPLPDRIRVVVDVEIERVVVRLGSGHRDASFDRASGSTTSPTRLRYGHATDGARPPHRGERFNTFPSRIHEIASGTEIITCEAGFSRSSSTLFTWENPAVVSSPGFQEA